MTKKRKKVGRPARRVKIRMPDKTPKAGVLMLDMIIREALALKKLRPFSDDGEP